MLYIYISTYDIRCISGIPLFELLWMLNMKGKYLFSGINWTQPPQLATSLHMTCEPLRYIACLSYCLVGKVSGWGSWDCCLRLEVKRKWRFKDFKDFDLLTHRPLVGFPAIMALCSGERAVILVTCLGAYFLSMAMIYQMSPFFEVYARNNCGASTVTVGLIFAAMPATSFLGNLVMDVMIRKFGVEVMMNCGLILLAMSSLGFGLSSSVTSWVIWRAMQGLATAPIYTSISTRLARTFTGDGEFHRVVGLQEVCGNVGVTVGPLLGGMLFEFGGFALPFITSAALHLIFVGISLASLLCKKKPDQSDCRISLLCKKKPDQSDPCVSDGSDGLESGSSDGSQNSDSVTLCSVASLRLFLLAGLPLLCLGVWGSFEPLLGEHFVKVLGPIDHSMIGFLMSLSAVPSTFAAIAVPSLLKCVRAKWLMAGGLLIYACGSFALGSAKLLTPWGSQIVGLLLIGCGWGLCWTPVLPSMVDSAASKLLDVSPELARHMVSPSVSSIFNAFAALGEASGPMLGTWLLPHHFTLGSKIIAIFLVLYAVCTFCNDPQGKTKKMHVDRLPTQTRLRSALPEDPVRMED